MSDFMLKLDLSGLPPHEDNTMFRRPRITVGVDYEPFHEGHIVGLHMDEQMGQPARWIEMTPDEARTLAGHLITCAQEAEDHPEPLPEKEDA